MQRVTVAILNWNGSELLKKFLPKVIEHSQGHEVVVIDNDSSDDSVAMLQSDFADIRVIVNQENLGFAAGYNVGLKEVDSDIIVLLNSDVEVTAGWIDKVLPHFEDPNIAALQPKLLDEKRKEFFEYAGAAGGFLDRFGFPFCRGRVFESLEEDKGQYDQVCDVHWASGACLFIRQSLYNEVGGLDADFFAHMEEIDLCWRIRNRGYRIICAPESSVYHVGGATLQQGSSHKAYLNFRNNLFILLKNDRSAWTTGLITFRMALDGVAAWKFLFSGQSGAFFAVAKAHFHFYTSFFKMLKKRMLLKKKEVHSAEIYKISVVYQHFIQKLDKYSDLRF